MKKIQFVLIMGTIFLPIITTTASAQLIAANNSYATTGNSESKTAKAAYKLEKANLRAMNNFKNEFINGPDVKWYAEEKVLTASFNRDDIKTTVIYDKKGHWMRTMQVYQENKMPADIRSMVRRSIYFDYKISLVQEIKEGEITFYVVHLEDERNYKQVCVYDGEISLLQEFTKSL